VKADGDDEVNFGSICPALDAQGLAHLVFTVNSFAVRPSMNVDTRPRALVDDTNQRWRICSYTLREARRTHRALLMASLSKGSERLEP